jgi:hypothetical protein
MHEFFLTRGDVEGLPFETQVQIHVPWNVVLLHEDRCHRIAQWEYWGKRICLVNIYEYHRPPEIDEWLDFMNGLVHSPIIQEARSKTRWLSRQ